MSHNTAFSCRIFRTSQCYKASCHVSWKLTNYCSRLDDVLISGEVALLRNEQILVTMTRDEKNVIISRKFYRSIYRGGIVRKFGLINSLSGCVRANFEDCCAQITISSRIICLQKKIVSLFRPHLSCYSLPRHLT